VVKPTFRHFLIATRSIPLFGDIAFIISTPYGVTELRHGPGIGEESGNTRRPSTHSAIFSVGNLAGWERTIPMKVSFSALVKPIVPYVSQTLDKHA
jgi:hypothetical protein